MARAVMAVMPINQDPNTRAEMSQNPAHANVAILKAAFEI
jgi:hypothetical protein